LLGDKKKNMKLEKWVKNLKKDLGGDGPQESFDVGKGSKKCNIKKDLGGDWPQNLNIGI
jgi:hypothetical protein